MNKVSFKHRKETWKVKKSDDKNDNHMSEESLKGWIKDGINEGLHDYNIGEIIGKMFDQNKIKQIVIDALVPKVMDACSPYYKQEFYSSISGDNIVISPWWDDHWQNLKIVDLIKKSVTAFDDTESLIDLKKALKESIEIVDKILEEQELHHVNKESD